MKIPVSDIEQFLTQFGSPEFEYFDESFEFKYLGLDVMIWNDRGLFHPFLSTPNISAFYGASEVGREFEASIHDGTGKLATLSSTLTFIKENNQRIKETLESKAFRESFKETYKLAPLPK